MAQRGGRAPRRPTSSACSAELQAALLPRDPDDARNAFLEIRAGTGGDESALFAADLARMYLRHAERQRLADRGDVGKRERPGRLQGGGRSGSTATGSTRG